MRLLKRLLLVVVILIAILTIGFTLYVHTFWDKEYDIPLVNLSVSSDSAVIAKGKYLVHGPAHCSNCHVSGIEDLIRTEQGEDVPLKGGVMLPLGPLGNVFAPNITPDRQTGIGRYTDGQLFRMMRHAVKPDGTATLSLMMPFWNMADEDLVAIVSYLRSLEPVHNPVPTPRWTFVGKTVRVLAPFFKPVENPAPPTLAPSMLPTAERGEYLARYVANCVGCHTRRDQMTFEPVGREYAGGMEFEPFPELHLALGVDPDLWTRSPNITPHPNSALSKFKSPDEWINRFRHGRIIMHSPMDWGPFSRMSDEDLGALWVYLHSLEPVENDVGPVVYKKD
jgi:mono/diheme cytochrome c family protein